jgi:hypothetical protein
MFKNNLSDIFGKIFYFCRKIKVKKENYSTIKAYDRDIG